LLIGAGAIISDDDGRSYTVVVTAINRIAFWHFWSMPNGLPGMCYERRDEEHVPDPMPITTTTTIQPFGACSGGETNWVVNEL
jgi:hypothetical protein